MSRQPDGDGECVIVHFVRLPTGVLRCRVVDAATKIAWLVPSADALHRLIFSSAPDEPAFGSSSTPTNETPKNED